MNLHYEQLRMTVQSTVIDLSGCTQHDVDGITKALWDSGIQTVAAFENSNDPDMFSAIVANHEITLSF